MILSLTYLFSQRGAAVANREEPKERRAAEHHVHPRARHHRQMLESDPQPEPVLSSAVEPSLLSVSP